MRERPKYEPFDNFVVTENVRALSGFNLPQLKDTITNIIESKMGGEHLATETPKFFDLFGACLEMAFDGDELVYDLGASTPSSPFGILTVMLASEGTAGQSD